MLRILDKKGSTILAAQFVGAIDDEKDAFGLACNVKRLLGLTQQGVEGNCKLGKVVADNLTNRIFVGRIGFKGDREFGEEVDQIGDTTLDFGAAL